LAFQLRKQNKLSACITIKIRYAGFDTYTTQARIPYTSCDHILIAKAGELFDKLYSRRQLVRLLGVRFSHLVGGNYQISLFEDTEELISLYQAMDRMRMRFNNPCAVTRAVSLAPPQKRDKKNQPQKAERKNAKSPAKCTSVAIVGLVSATEPCRLKPCWVKHSKKASPGWH
jgi:DNA polymerase-4